MEKQIELGDIVQDLVTGFKGMAVARTKWITGCDRITVCPEHTVGKDIATEAFDESMLKIVKRATKTVKERRDTDGLFTPKEAPKTVGGPVPRVTQARYGV